LYVFYHRSTFQGKGFLIFWAYGAYIIYEEIFTEDDMGRESFTSIRDKDVINICDGKRLGYVCDLEIDACDGRICAIIVIFDCRGFGFGKCEELIIPWEKIKCFGKDAVLVNISTEIYAKLGCCEKNEKKR
jgi:YlmC/YmxH family sporulation protein